MLEMAASSIISEQVIRPRFDSTHCFKNAISAISHVKKRTSEGWTSIEQSLEYPVDFFFHPIEGKNINYVKYF